MTDTSPPPRQALGIGLEEFEYPYSVGFFPVTSDLQSLTMAYMDVPPSAEPNGSTAVLMHGEGFGVLLPRSDPSADGGRLPGGRSRPDRLGQVVKAGHPLQLPTFRRQHGGTP